MAKTLSLAHEVFIRESKTSLWYAIALYEDSVSEWTNPYIDPFERCQAWQRIQGLIAVLKTRGAWDSFLDEPISDGAPTSPEGYKEITPGSPEWLAYWKAHPDEQPDMINWRSDYKLMKIATG